MAKILVLGADGMVGHVARIHLATCGHDVRSIARSQTELWDRLDVEDLTALRAFLENERFDFVINCVGVLIQESEADPLRAIRLNAMLPQFLNTISEELSFRVIQASTDCVFSGGGGPYTEASQRDADNVYGRTKALGELNNKHNLTIRTSKIGPELQADGTGLFHWFMQQTGTIRGFGKALWGGVTTLEYAKAIDWVTKNPTSGLVHLTNGEGISKYDLLCLIGEIWGKTDVVIERVDSHVSDRSLRSVRSDFAYVVPSYRDMLLELREFMTKHSEIYSGYC